MSAGAPYTRYHPRWYRRRVSVWWWLESWRYTRFVLRELSSLAVAFFGVVMLAQLYALGAGEEAFAQFSAWLRSPLALALHTLALAFVLLHTLTWFHLAPKAMVVRVGGKRLPDALIVAGNYAAWLAATAAVAWALLRG